MIPEKLPQLPKAMFRTPCHVKIFGDSLNDDGEQEVLLEDDLKCCFSEKRKQIMDAEKHIIQLEGQAMFIGDIAPDVPQACTGEFSVGTSTYKIHAVKRPRNPDTSIHHTTLELM